MYGYREVEWQSILHKDVDNNSDATVEMVDEDSDARVVMEVDAELETNGVRDETKMKSNVLGDELRICNTVRTEDERSILNSHFRDTTNAKMLFL
jgi:hypothetical protein